MGILIPQSHLIGDDIKAGDEIALEVILANSDFETWQMHPRYDRKVLNRKRPGKDKKRADQARMYRYWTNYNELPEVNLGLMTAYFASMQSLALAQGKTSPVLLATFPTYKSPYFYEEMRKGLEERLAERSGVFGDDGLIVLGISVSDRTYPIAAEMAEISRKFGNILVGVGGPWCGVDMPEKYKDILERNVFDWINVGHCSPFAGLVANLSNKKASAIKKKGIWSLEGEIPEGLRYMDADGSYSGSGVGKFPELKATHPFSVDVRFMIGKSREPIVDTFLGKPCQNRCDYCAITPLGSETDAREIAGKIFQHRLGRRKNIRAIILGDPDLLSGRNLKSLYSFDNRLKELGKNVRQYSVFCNPYFFAGSHRKRVKKAIKDLNIRGICVGMDVGRGCENTIGERIMGKELTLQMTDKRYERLYKLFGFMETLKGRSFIKISSTWGPFETKESVLRQIIEATYIMMDIASYKVAASYTTGILHPYSGTELARRYAGKFMPFEMLKPVDSYTDSLNQWGYDDGITAGHFLDYHTMIGVCKIRRDKSKLETAGMCNMFSLFNLLCAELGFGDFSMGFDAKAVTESIFTNHAYVINDIINPAELDGKKLKRVKEDVECMHNGNIRHYEIIKEFCQIIAERELYMRTPEKKAELYAVNLDFLEKESPSFMKKMNSDKRSIEEYKQWCTSTMLNFLGRKEEYFRQIREG